MITALVLPIMRSPARDGDPDEQREQQDGNEDDQEYRHDCLPQESDDHPQVDLPVTANLQTRAAPFVAATKELIGLASARTGAPSGTSPAMRPPHEGRGPGHSGATPPAPPSGTPASVPGKIGYFARSAWDCKRSYPDSSFFLIAVPGRQ